MPRDYRIYAEDISEAIAKINRYMKGLDRQTFSDDEKTFDAVVRNIEVIGEAVKKLPEHIRIQHPTVEWKKIAGVRDILIHEYFGIDVEIIWDIIQNKLPALEKEVSHIVANP
ncbi:MAG TPA: DUF86 domain-containing protein [Nitrospiraceae bacterium]|nr:DUF86 domain-containing protein [Nitrospiraceae bacterium]